MLKEWKDFWKAFIPQRVSNSWVIGCMQLGACVGRCSKAYQERHEKENTAVLSTQSATLFAGRYIEKQQNWSEVRFGKGKDNTIAHSGCGIIAIYNALALLEQWEKPKFGKMVELISFFEKKGAVLGGRYGVSPNIIAEYLKGQGYLINFMKCNAHTTKDVLNVIGEESQTVIVTFFNHEHDITRQMHTVCVTKEQGRFFAHNAFSFAKKAKDGTDCLIDAVNASAIAPKVICAIGISKRENNHINS